MFAGNRGPSWDPRAQTSSLVPRRWDHEGDWVLNPPGLTVSQQTLFQPQGPRSLEDAKALCGQVLVWSRGRPVGTSRKSLSTSLRHVGGSSSAPRVLSAAGRTGPSKRLVLAASLAFYSPGTCSRHATRLPRDPKTLKLGINTRKSLTGALPYS